MRAPVHSSCVVFHYPVSHLRRQINMNCPIPMEGKWNTQVLYTYMALRATHVDFLKQDNASLHNTSEYDNSNLIVRRGQPFKLKISFDNQVTQRNKVTLQFTTGSRPMKANGTLVAIELNSSRLPYDWSAKTLENHGRECTVVVNTPANAIIGKYFLSIITGRGMVYMTGDCPIYVLCNPWCKDDSVYMPNEDERKEYVLNDTGYIYVGSQNNIKARPWNFGQHEEDVLDCCFFLLDRSGLKPAARRDPVILSRKFSALVNSNDDHGVLTGNWSGKYSAGCSPTSWTGSSAILQKFYKTKKPVLFGQCWVFSGVVTTVMRCIGIPARSVTNFSSAHDTEENLKIDFYMNEKGEKMDEYCSDSVWNFHVWNDVWMKRPDLPSGYDGWQAIDATPQEPSEGVFQCGPCSLTALKKGIVYLPYDAKFVFAEVNADKMEWMVKEIMGDEQITLLREEKKSIGKNISTKAVNRNLRQDITLEYKHKEGSPEERETFQVACSNLKSDACLVFAAPPVRPPPGIKIQITGEKELPPGNPLSLNIVIENESDQSKTVNVTAGCQLQAYTGKIIASLASITETVEVAEKQVATIPVNIAADQYMKFMTLVDDELMIRLNVITETKEEKNSECLVISFIYPPIKVEMPETGKINEDFTCTFTFKNTLSVPLEKCELHVEGLGLFRLEKFDQGDVKPGGIFRSKIICAPRKVGERKIVAELLSKQIKGIHAEKIINITQ
ncbi:protein-glutamine gamma-glutamyltransferase 4 isoform X1 [Hyla sarda]|uniref:protein-glutamine gamma-glutamyltransferase 4 isoform X1 n=2 Tax=Hyla sarda TaxID=327740 RepID=UPI0024C2284C|nr:protein-glutamine gamma-glutamyltransferase 4 isoform X1 [Hyla sarda]